jgi:hypothetical protein
VVVALSAVVAALAAFVVGSATPASAGDQVRPPVTGSVTGDFAKAFVALTFAPVSDDELWAANGGVIELSRDGGQRWTIVTPPNLVGDDPGTRLAGFASYGANDLWFAAGSAADAASHGMRGFAIEHSADAGRTWSWTGVPGCTSCSTMSLSFVSPEAGWALGSNGNLWATTSGGRRWSRVAKTPSAVDGLPNGIDFIDGTTGWLTASPSLYRTVDGGRRWRRITLPEARGDRPTRLGTPHFFDANAGEIPAVLTDGSAVVYATADEGVSWTTEPAPVSVAVFSPGWWVLPGLYAATRTIWSTWSGTRLYVTTNAGKTWRDVPSPPLYADDQPTWGFAMGTPTRGWIDASAARCPGGRRVGNCGVPILLRTTDGGRHWQTINQPTR